jgi:hypothetical protein
MHILTQKMLAELMYATLTHMMLGGHQTFPMLEIQAKWIVSYLPPCRSLHGALAQESNLRLETGSGMGDYRRKSASKACLPHHGFRDPLGSHCQIPPGLWGQMSQVSLFLPLTRGKNYTFSFLKLPRNLLAFRVILSNLFLAECAIKHQIPPPHDHPQNILCRPHW